MSTLPKRRDRTRRPAPHVVAEFSHRVRKAMVDAFLQLGSVMGRDDAALTIERAAQPIAPPRMASQHPGGTEARMQAQALYERCLARYRETAHANAGPDVDDVGAAVARFVAANLRALRGVDATPEMLLKLERQLVGIVRASPCWAGVSARERQFFFEQIAIVAVLIEESFIRAVGESLQAVAHVQQAARGYLQHFLGLNPDVFALGPDGLQLASASDRAMVVA